MPVRRLFYHIVWATEGRFPAIHEEVEPAFYRVMGEKVERLGGWVLALNGMPDHIHLVSAVPPTLALSDFIGQVKGVSSHFMNHERGMTFRWQEGYGVFSISERNLKSACAYVRNQKAHHAEGTTIPALEQVSILDKRPRTAGP